MHEDQEDGGTVTHVSTVEARGGSRTKATRNILAISLFMVVAAFVGIVGFGYFRTAQTGADDVSADNTALNQSR